MRLPNAAQAFIDLQTLTNYVLDPTSPMGRHKARVFRSALGISAADALTLADLILEAVNSVECVVGEQDIYGQRYSVDCKIEFKGRSAVVRTAWIIKREEDFPRLTTCFVMRG